MMPLAACRDQPAAACGRPTLPLPSAVAVSALHDDFLRTHGWPDSPRSGVDAGPLWRHVETNHRCNALLWAQEDLARRSRVGAEDIAANKRAIDRHNQVRNDEVERIDEWLLTALGLVDVDSAAGDAPRSTVARTARLNSETAGSMIDRLSILSLKIHAMRQQLARTDVDAAHLHASQARLARLQEQRTDLQGCFDALLAEAKAGRAYFKVYRQFKLYNDSRFNPVLVAEGRAADNGLGRAQP